MKLEEVCRHRITNGLNNRNEKILSTNEQMKYCEVFLLSEMKGIMPWQVLLARIESPLP